MPNSIVELLSSPYVLLIMGGAVLVAFIRSFRSRLSLLEAAKTHTAEQIQGLLDAGVVSISYLPTDTPLSGTELVELAYSEAVPDSVVRAEKDAAADPSRRR